MGFWRSVFSDGNQGSASRVMMAFHAVAGAAWCTHVVIHTHAIPDAVTMAGVTGFVTAPYAINALHKAVSSLGGNNAPGPTSTP